MKSIQSAFVTGRPVDLERVELDRVPRPLVVIRKAALPRADLVLAGFYEQTVRCLTPARLGRRDRLRPRLVALDHLEELEHRFVVLVLVSEDQLVDEPFCEQPVVRVLELDPVEDLKRPLAHLGHVRAKLVAAQDRQLVASRARVLDRVVEAAEVAIHRLAPADRLDEPELLEVRDVAEVPGQRREDVRVDAVELVVGERLDQPQRHLARLGEALRDLVLQIGPGLRRRDDETLVTSPALALRASYSPNTLPPRWKSMAQAR